MANETERGSIVDWLKFHERTASAQGAHWARLFREGIERGDHLKGARRNS